MRKFATIFSCCLFGSAALTASWCDSVCDGCSDFFRPCQSSEWPSPFNIQVGGGIREDNFKWSVSGETFDETPVFLSDLHWKELRIAQIEGTATYVSCTNYAIKVAGDYGHIYHGRVTDSDFLTNPQVVSELNRFAVEPDDNKFLYSRSENKAGKGYVYDVLAGVGYRVTSTRNRFVAIPMAGYSYHSQHLHMTDGNQVFDFFHPRHEGKFAGLDSDYKTRWYGVWAGMDFTVRVEKCAYVFGGFEWHWVNYRAIGCWNLRSDLPAFNHKSHGAGYFATLGGNWELCSNWSIGVVGHYRFFQTRGGEESTGLDQEKIGERTSFNGAKWHSMSVSGIVAYRW